MNKLKRLFFVLLSVFFFAQSYASAPSEFTVLDLSLLACVFTLVFSVQIFLACMLAGRKTLQNLALAVMATIDIFYLNLVINDVFVDLPRMFQALALLGAAWVVYTLMDMIDNSVRAAKLLSGLAGLACVVVFVNAALKLPAQPPTPSFVPFQAKEGRTSAENIRLVNFESRPNVYFISFDSIIPQGLLKRHLDIDSTPYHDVLDKHFRRYRNFFADNVWTTLSLNSLLALDISHFSKAMKDGSHADFFPGLKPSPLLEVFKHNGYETNTMHSDRHLGSVEGPYVDHYIMSDWAKNFGACQFIPLHGFVGYRNLTFLGYCALLHIRPFQSLMEMAGLGNQRGGVEFFVGNFRAAAKREKPQLFVTYIYSPGHVPMSMDARKREEKEEYREYYVKASKEAAEYMQAIVDFIKKEDPDAIVYIFGDHGPGVFRRGSFKEEGGKYVQDVYGVYGGIYPKDRCPEAFSDPYNEEFVTVIQGAHMLIRCLTGGQYAFVDKMDIHLPPLDVNVLEYAKRDNTENSQLLEAFERYENHLYE